MFNAKFYMSILQSTGIYILKIQSDLSISNVIMPVLAFDEGKIVKKKVLSKLSSRVKERLP